MKWKETKKKLKKLKKWKKKLTFGVLKFGVEVLTCTWQEGMGNTILTKETRTTSMQEEH
jgi:hypothetical protein